MKKSTQASRIIRKFGGAARLAKLLNCDKSTVYKWTYPVSKQGTDGHIPRKQISRIKELAALLGLKLTAEDLTP